MLKQLPINRVILEVPFAEKGEAMKYGACWDTISGKWWTPHLNIANRAAVYRWIPKGNPLKLELKKALQFLQRESRKKARYKGSRHDRRSSHGAPRDG